MGEVVRECRESYGREAVDNVVIGFRRDGDMNRMRREFDLPQSTNNIAAVFYGVEPPFQVDLVLYPRRVAGDGQDRGDLRRHEIKNLNPLSDPLVYPVLFPLGEDGYSISLRHNNKKITMRQFYRYRIHCRGGFSLLHNGGKLFQQYLVDAWVRVEADYLWYIKTHQDLFRRANNEAVRRLIAGRPDAAGRIGRAVILPAAFRGGFRNVHRQYLDAMNVVARHGKPDLFITFTCNPNWPEIRDNLEYGQRFEHRSDLVCRVFRVKFLQFLEDVVHRHVYGIVKNYHYVIEFQKRGLPHAHMVITFVAENRIVSAEDVDCIISTRIPCPAEQPRLRHLVGLHQIHRICGRSDPAAPCMKDGFCSKNFPFRYTDATRMGGGGNGRPLYRRPKDGRFVLDKGRRYHNNRVVAYNPYALAKYQTHINFEVVGSLASMKYLYKYVSKGPDCVTVAAGRADAEGDPAAEYRIDEVRRYLECRYVSAMEAAWNLFEFKMHGRSHAVTVLPVHLPDRQFVVLNELDDMETLEGRLDRSTKLEAWFELNLADERARAYRYVEIPENYVWDDKRCRWNARRQVSKMIGCIAEVSPREGYLELFYLRLLLRYVPGATSFDYLKTVDCVLYDMFHAACRARRLLEDVREYDRALEEAVLMRHPRHLRRFFAYIACIVVAEDMAEIRNLWIKYREDLMADYLARGLTRRQALVLCVRDVESVVGRNRPDFSCAEMGIAVDDEEEEDGEDDDPVDPEADRGLVGDRERYVPENLTRDQRRIFFRVLKAVCRRLAIPVPGDIVALFDGDLSDEELRGDADERLFYVDGPGGTGKTFVYNVLVNYLTSALRVPVIAVAWTGIAANLLMGGMTCHRTFGLSLHLSRETVAGWPVEDARSDQIRRTALIIWDEAPMSHVHAVSAVDRYLRELSGDSDAPMGGFCCVFGGDFRQVLPVVPRGHRADVIEVSLKRWSLWGRVTKLALTENLRAGGGDDVGADVREQLGGTFGDWLLRLGEARLPYVPVPRVPQAPMDLVDIPRIFRCDDLEGLLDFVYAGDFVEDAAGGAAILCPTNAMVNRVNSVVLGRVEGDVKTYVSTDAIVGEEDDEFRVPMDVLNSVDVASLPPHELVLKVGVMVTLLRNLDIEMGECNGTRLRVLHLGDCFMICEIAVGERRGQQIWLSRMKMTARDSMIPHEIERFQFPVRLGFAMTVNKSQGQTFDRLGVYLERPCFGHGQLYVACSRVRSPAHLKICVRDGLTQGRFAGLGGRVLTRNVVYRSILNDEPVGAAVADGAVAPPGGVPADVNASDDELRVGDEAEEEMEMWLGRLDVSGILARETAANRDTRNLLPVEEEDLPEEDLPEEDLPRDRVPLRTASQLRRRESRNDAPGTSGLGDRRRRVISSFFRTTPPSSSTSTESESD